MDVLWTFVLSGMCDMAHTHVYVCVCVCVSQNVRIQKRRNKKKYSIFIINYKQLTYVILHNVKMLTCLAENNVEKKERERERKRKREKQYEAIII